jgi:thiol-disulfide isomerase/thioredoxin
MQIKHYSGLMGLVFMFGLGGALPALADDAGVEVGPEVGQQAPEFDLADLNGGRASLSGLRQKGHVMLIFWSTRCAFCHALIPEFKAIHEKYRDKGLTVAAVNVGFEDAPEVDAYALEYDLNYLILNEDDKKESLAADYRLMGTPTIEVVSPQGIVLYRGHFLPKDLEALLAARS